MAVVKMNKTIRMQILQNVFSKHISPVLQKFEKDLKKDLRELIKYDPDNYESNEIHDRYKARFPRMFRTEASVKAFVEPSHILLEECIKDDYYGYSLYPNNIFVGHSHISKKDLETFLTVKHSYSVNYITIDPPIINNNDGDFDKYLKKGNPIRNYLVNYIKTANKQIKELAEFFDGLSEILLSCKTVDQFYEGYPEFREFIPEIAKKPQYLVPTDTVNKTMKILKKLKNHEIP